MPFPSHATRWPWCRVFAFWLVVAGAAIAADDAPTKDSAEGIEFFRKRIRPILVERCYKCHSEKAEKIESGLRLDSRDGVRRGGDQGPAVDPGDLKRSLLYQAILYEMDDLKMPPDRRLDDEQVADIRKWIEMGAPDPRDQSDAKTP